MRPPQEFPGDLLRRVDGLPGLVDHDAGRAGGLRIDLEDHGLRDSDATRLEGGFERRAKVDHLPVRRSETRLHEEMALFSRRRIGQVVRALFRSLSALDD